MRQFTFSVVLLLGPLFLGAGQVGCTDGGGGNEPIATSDDVQVWLVNPTAADPFSGIDSLRLQISREGEVLFLETFEIGTTAEFPDLAYYGRLRFELAGLFGESVASLGRSAEVVVVPGEDTEVNLLFLPVNRAYAIEGDAAKLRSDHGAALLPNGRVLLFGGANKTRAVAFDDTETWDPVSGKFLPGPLLPAGVLQPQWDWSGELELFGAGGKEIMAGQVPSDLTWRYDPAEDVVEELSGFNEARSGHCFAFFRDEFAVAMGGTDSESTIESLRPNKDDGVWAWSSNTMDELTASAVTGCVSALDDRVFVQGLEQNATGVFDYTAESAARNPEISSAFVPMVTSAESVFLDGAMLIPLQDGGVWVGGGLSPSSVPFTEGRNFDMANRVFVQGVAPDEVRVDGSWDHWIEPDWAVLGCGSPDGDATHSQASVELLNLATGDRFTTFELERSRPGCQVTTLADGSLFVSGGYAVTDGEDEASAAIIVPYQE